MNNNFEKEKELYSSRYNEELNKTGIFFAFSNQQFEENKIPKDETEGFISCGGGMYIHKKNKSKLDDFFNITEKKLQKDFLSKTTIEEMIQYELINHECFLTGEPFEILELIRSYYQDTSEDEIKRKIESIYSKNQEIWEN